MKSFDKKDIYSWANCEEAKKYIGKQGFIGASLGEISERLKKGGVVILQDVEDTGINCFYFEIGIFKDCSSGLFLPLDKVKEVEEPKKYRPFKAIFEFDSTLNSQVGESIRLRAKCSDPFENVFLIDGFTETSKRELKYIFLSGIRYSPEELLRNYEFNKDGHWQPFGVEE